MRVTRLLIPTLSLFSCYTNMDYYVPTQDGGADACVPNSVATCYSGPSGTEGRGICTAGAMTCDGNGNYGPCIGDVTPQPEDCATPIDENCDGIAEPCIGQQLWTRSFGDGCVSDIAVDADGSVTMIGWFDGVADFGGGPLVSIGHEDMFIAKLSSSGEHVWSRSTGGVVDPAGIALDGTGRIIVTGSFTGTMDFGGGPLTGADDVFLASLGPDGAHLWSKAFGDDAAQYARSVAADASGDIVVTGDFNGTLDFGGAPMTSVGVFDSFVVRLSSDGGHVWSRQFGSSSAVGKSIKADSLGSVLTLGDFRDSIDFGAGPLMSAGLEDIFLVALSADGSYLWGDGFGDVSAQTGNAMAIAPNGDVVITGDFAGSLNLGGDALQSQGLRDIFLARTDLGGGRMWSVSFGGLSNDSGYDVQVDSSGNVILTGRFSGEVDFGGGALASAGSEDGFLAKFDGAGQHVWSKRFDGKGLAAALDATGSVYVSECDSLRISKFSP